MQKVARFPEDISYGSVGGPMFFTDITELNHGQEQRRSNWTHPRNRYNLIYETKSHDKLAKLIAFFYSHKGRAIPFLFKDWMDYQATRQNIGTGDGAQLSFQLVKHYNSGTYYSYTRRINNPVPETVKVYIGEVQQSSNAYTVNYGNGRLTFLDPPKVGKHIYTDYEFDVLVRFDTDFLACSLNNHSNFGCSKISLVEVKG